ncbi:MAG TPA: tetratricopeptide repeat protein, partial [Nitrospiria bacterium]|nr:tetratricopeptide repeat protein [Nitrospiria bacterium]
YYNRGNAYERGGKIDQAIADYTKSIGIDPKRALAYYGRGIAYTGKGQFDLAIADFDKTIAMNPKHEYAYLRLLTATWLSKGKDDKAIGELRHFVAADPTESWVRTLSRYYLGMDNLNEQSVLAQAGKGKEAKERLCEAYFFLGVKRLAAGNREGAADYFTKSVGTGETAATEYQSSKALLELMKSKKI